MKRFISIFLALVMSFSFVACGSSAPADSTTENDTQQETTSEETEQKLEVDENLLSVEITLPASYWEGEEETVEEYAARMKEEGRFKDVKANDDGSVTVTMSKSDHKTLLSETRATFETMFPLEGIASVKSLEINDNVTDCRLIVDKTGFENSFDSFAVLGVAISVQLYHVLEGEPDTVTVIHYIDEASGEEFGVFNVPEDLNKIGE